jgi:DNA-binding transcriptional regulator GbsR (MarR family)
MTAKDNDVPAGDDDVSGRVDARPNDAVRRFIERFALLLTEAGMARMPARAFAALLAEDSGRLTAAELAERLEVSPAAISGAVRYLTQVGMVARDREPGARRDHYRLHEDVWTGIYLNRLSALKRWEEAVAEGVEVLGTDRPAGRRVEETREFFAFLQDELPAVVEHWRRRRAAATAPPP